MAINDTTVPGLPAGRPTARLRRPLIGHSGAQALPCPADVDATPLHLRAGERVARAPVDGAGASTPVEATTAPAPHQALRALLEAHHAVAAELSLPRVLQVVVDAAREITGAQYAALTLFTPDSTPGTPVVSGVPEQTASGVLPDPGGPAVPDRRPSLGRPPGRSRCGSFSMPLTARGSVLGHLHVSGPPAGAGFSAEAEDLVAALAITAGVAVENVRWLRGAGDPGRDLLHRGPAARAVRLLSALGLVRATSDKHGLRGQG